VLFSRLGLGARDWCCADGSRLPPASVEDAAPRAPTTGPASAYAAFYPLCASCHATSELTPPNFLSGSAERVVASVRHCAPRIYARLAMWRVAPDVRDKTPMPPPRPKAGAAVYSAPASVAALERAAAGLLRAESGNEPRIEELLAGGYEALRPCLAVER
jgi:mono/diheme cytochrome c family protein